MEAHVLDLVVGMIKSNKEDFEKRLDALMESQKRQDEKLDELLAYKWRLAGMTAVLSLIGGIVIQIIIAKVGN